MWFTGFHLLIGIDMAKSVSAFENLLKLPKPQSYPKPAKAYSKGGTKAVVLFKAVNHPNVQAGLGSTVLIAK